MTKNKYLIIENIFKQKHHILLSLIKPTSALITALQILRILPTVFGKKKECQTFLSILQALKRLNHTLWELTSPTPTIQFDPY